MLPPSQPRAKQSRQRDAEASSAESIPVQPSSKRARPILRSVQPPLSARQFWDKFDTLALLLWARNYESYADSIKIDGIPDEENDVYSKDRLISYMVEQSIPYPSDEDEIRINLIQRASHEQKKTLGDRVPGLLLGETWNGNKNAFVMEKEPCDCRSTAVGLAEFDVPMNNRTNQMNARCLFGDNWLQHHEMYCASDEERVIVELVLDTTNHIQINCSGCQRHMELRLDRVKATGESFWQVRCNNIQCRSTARHDWSTWRSLASVAALPKEGRLLEHSKGGYTLVLGKAHTIGVVHDRCGRDVELSMSSSPDRQAISAKCETCNIDSGFYRKNTEFAATYLP